jgi:hypothetical protein
VKFLAGALIALVIFSAGAIKFLKTPRGMALLLDSGFTVYYDQLREIVGKELLSALEAARLREHLHERVETFQVDGKRYRFANWKVECGEACDLIQINLILTRAVRRSGVRVRASAEEEEGNTLRFEVGTRHYLTHRILIRKGGVFSEEVSTPLPKLAIVIDDFGYGRNAEIEAFLSLDLPITISIIPSLPFTEYTASRASQHGKEVIMHLPMEPEEPHPSDVEMVLTSHNDRRIRRLVERYLQDVPEAVGVSNHMGSKATRDERVMKAVLSVLMGRGLFFLDSLTSSKSVAYNVAKQMGMGAVRNDLFLDADTRDPDVIEERLQRLVELAKHRGHAIGIGHPKPWTFNALLRNQALLKDSGVQLVFVSDLIGS